MKILLIGAGAWGQKYIDTFKQWPHIELCIATRQSWKKDIDQVPDGVIICTPPSSHIEIARYSLEHHIPVMIEKPLALTHQDASQLIPLQNNAPILVNHIHLFSDYFQELMRQCPLNQITQIDALNLRGNSHHNYSALYDQGCHDVSMILELMKEYPTQIEAKFQTGFYDIDLQFSNKKAHIEISNKYNPKIRYLKVKCNNSHIFYNDHLMGDKLTGIEHNIKNAIPPLTNSLQCFFSLIEGKSDTRAGLDLPLQVMQILDECQRQIGEV